MLSISLAWSNLNQDGMFSNHGVEWDISDEGGIARFNLSACLDTKGFHFHTHFLLEGLGESHFVGNFTWQVNGNDFR